MKFTIFGSCVTRDAFAFASVYESQKEFAINEYFARCSVVSAMAEPIIVDEEIYNDEKFIFEHKFNKKAISRDLNKTFKLQEWIPDTDYLIIDLTEERWRIQEIILENGKKSYIAYSNVFAESGMEKAFSLRLIGRREKNSLYK